METNNLNNGYLSRDELIQLHYCSFLEYVGSCKCDDLAKSQWIDYNCVNDNQLIELFYLVDENIQALEDGDECECGECFKGAMYSLKDLILKRLQALKAGIKQPQQTTIQDNILNELENQRIITKEPLKWIGAKNLCAYFVDNYFKTTTNKWEVGKELFGVANMAQLKDLYENSNSGKPKNYKIIDRILSANK